MMRVDRDSSKGPGSEGERGRWLEGTWGPRLVGFLNMEKDFRRDLIEKGEVDNAKEGGNN